MQFLLEYVFANGRIAKIQIDQHNYRHAMGAVDKHFEDISEFIGNGHVETINVTQDVTYCVHDESLLMDTPPNLRPDLYHLLGTVVIVKAVVDGITPELFGDERGHKAPVSTT